MTLRAIVLGLCCGVLAISVHAASPRAAWVTQALYADHHPYATQASAELDKKMDKMRLSAFNFFRGTAPLFYRDMPGLPASAFATPQTAQSYLCGDAHLANLAAFADGAGEISFALSDFDEAARGPYEWDLRRMAVSIVLAGQDNKLDEKEIAPALGALGDAYVAQMKAFADKPDSARSFRLQENNTRGAVKEALQEAAGKSRRKLLARYTERADTGRRFESDEALSLPPAASLQALPAAMKAYIATIPASLRQPESFYAVKDMRQKLGSGIGSLGRLRYWVLIEGPSKGDEDDIILEFKQAAPSAVNLALPATAPSGKPGLDPLNDARRISSAMQAQLLAPDPLVGYARIGALSYSVREKLAQQEDFDTTRLKTADKLAQAAGYAGQALAHAHALPDAALAKAISVATSRPGFTAALSDFAFDYAKQVLLDWEAYKAAKAARYY